MGVEMREGVARNIDEREDRKKGRAVRGTGI